MQSAASATSSNSTSYHSKPSQLSDENSGHCVPPGIGQRSAEFRRGPASLYCEADSKPPPQKPAPSGHSWPCAPAETNSAPSCPSPAAHQMCQIGCRLVRPKAETGIPCLPAINTLGLVMTLKQLSMAMVLCSCCIWRNAGVTWATNHCTSVQFLQYPHCIAQQGMCAQQITLTHYPDATAVTCQHACMKKLSALPFRSSVSVPQE